MAQRNQMPIRRQGGAWNPVRDISRLYRGIDRLFDDIFSPVLSDTGMEDMIPTAYVPPMDVRDEDKQIVLSLDLPGVNSDDVRIDIQDNLLAVTGERRVEREEGERGRRYVERAYGTFQRVFTLPANVNTDQIQANFNNGVLEIVLPKAETARARRIEVGQGKEQQPQRIQQAGQAQQQRAQPAAQQQQQKKTA